MTKQQAQPLYAAYAELEAAAEAFYNAATKMAELLPAEANSLYAICESVNMVVAGCDAELDEVL